MSCFLTMRQRSWQKALLSALCTPNEDLKKMQDASDWTEVMVRQEMLKTMPFGDVWEEYCVSCETSADDWFEEVKRYEKDVLAKRA